MNIKCVALSLVYCCAYPWNYKWLHREKLPSQNSFYNLKKGCFPGDLVMQSSYIPKVIRNNIYIHSFNLQLFLNKTEVHTKLNSCLNAYLLWLSCLHVLIGLSVWLLMRKKESLWAHKGRENGKQKGDFSKLAICLKNTNVFYYHSPKAWMVWLLCFSKVGHIGLS